MDMNKLMRPQSLVVVGASEKRGMVGGATRSAVKGVNRDRVYYLNPKYDTVLGRRCYHDLSDLPEVPDCILICTPARTVAGYLEQAGKLGVGAAVVLASGFSEERTEEAHALSRQVKEICLQYDIALCGPNCIGIVNGIDKVCATANNDETMTMLQPDQRRGVGVVAQSGYISSGFNNPDCDYLACVVSAGNGIISGLEDYLLYYANEDRVNCIAAYIEGISKPDVLEQALRTAAEKRKPVVVLKAGSSEKGSFAAASHTGSMAGSYRSVESVLKKFGVIITRSLQELVSTARMFAVLDGKLPVRPGLGGVNFSGGENTLCADSCERFGLALPEFAPATLEAIRSVVPPYATPANPLDATTTLFSENEKVRTLFRAVRDDPSVGLVLLGNDVGLNSEPKDVTCAEILSELASGEGMAPTVVIPSFEKPRNADIRARFEGAGIPVLSTGDTAYSAIRHLMDFAAFDPAAATLSLALPEGPAPAGRHTLSEAESKAALAAAGVPIPAQRLVEREADLSAALDGFPFPLVMKIDSPDIPHKTEAGGVRLGVCTVREAQAAFREILDSCRTYAPEAHINGVMLQEQAPQGMEVLVGVTNDAQFGPLLLVGLGGVYAEALKDTALYPCPLTRNEAMGMLRSLRCWPLFTGWRGAPPLDADALAGLMVSVSSYACAHKNDLAELDLNPVFVYEQGKGVCAADALIVRRGEEA